MRFNQIFLENSQSMLNKLVNLTETICQAIDSAKADMTIYDFFSIKVFVAENDSKYVNSIIKQLIAYAKTMGLGKNYAPYKEVYENIPSHAAVNPEIKQLYINEHFCSVQGLFDPLKRNLMFWMKINMLMTLGFLS